MEQLLTILICGQLGFFLCRRSTDNTSCHSPFFLKPLGCLKTKVALISFLYR